MCNILYVSSSPRGSASYSSRVAARVIDELRQAESQLRLTVANLRKIAPSHRRRFRRCDEKRRWPKHGQTTRYPYEIGCFGRRAARRRHRRHRGANDQLQRLHNAEVLVRLCPRAGRTFSYSETGPKGVPSPANGWGSL